MMVAGLTDPTKKPSTAATATTIQDVGIGQSRLAVGRGETATAIVPGPTCAPTTAPSSTSATVAVDGSFARRRSCGSPAGEASVHGDVDPRLPCGRSRPKRQLLEPAQGT